jgi:hypothetical protein
MKRVVRPEEEKDLITEQAGEAVMPYIYVRAMLGLNLGWGTGYTD